MTTRLVLDPLVEIYEIDADTVVLAADDAFLRLQGNGVADHVAALARGKAGQPAGPLADALAAHQLMIEQPEARREPVVPSGYATESAACARLAEQLGELPELTSCRIVIGTGWADHTSDRLWLLVLPGRRSVTVSPLFGNDSAPCWSCTHRRVAAREDRRTALRQTSIFHPIPDADRWFHPELVDRVRTAIADAASPNGILYRVGVTTTEHPVVPVPDCPVCAVSTQRRVPTVLADVLDPVTGIVADRHATTLGGKITVAVTTYADPSGAVDQPRFAYGAATSVAEARARARSEAMERYCALARPDDGDVIAPLAEMAGDVVHPSEVMRFAEDQPGRPRPPTAPIRWSRVRSLDGQQRWMATGLCVALPAGHPDNRYCVYESNGTAAATTWDLAVVRAFLEVVERDAVAIWWYNRVPRPAVDLSTFTEIDVKAAVADLSASTARLTVYEVTSDIPVPTFAALARRPGSTVPHLGFGAHFDAGHAVRSALLEACQAVCFPARDERLWADFDWSGQPQLADVQPTRSAGDYAAFDREPTVDDCVSVAPTPVLVHDFARQDMPLECVRVFVPGCHGFAPRFAPGRITDVPIRLGMLQPLAGFNPEPIRS